ncbi:MAG: hypothetical protein ACR2NZ_17305 [Rubripirellula sp.]
MIRPSFLALPVVLFATAFPAIAQRNSRPDRSPSAETSADSVRPSRSRGGGGQLPQSGTMFPSLNVVDEQGQAFSTDTLRGSYTVLVFGCLT